MTTYGFIFIIRLSFRILGGWVEDASPLPLRSSFVSMGRVASTMSMLWEASFSLEGSLGAAGGRLASWVTSSMSTAFSASLNYFASLGGMLVVGRALVGLSLPSSASLETILALEPEEQMTGG